MMTALPRPAVRRAFTAILVLVSLAGLCHAASSLWQVTSGRHSVYLLGSVHMLQPRHYPLAPAIRKAYAESQVLVLEADPGDLQAASMSFLTSGMGRLDQGDSLKQHVHGTTWEKAQAILSKMGLDIAFFAQYKPWLLALTLTTTKLQMLGYNPQLGLDLHFYQKALQDGKPVFGLETLSYQYELLNSLGTFEQDAFLAKTLDQFDDMQRQITRLVQAWESGNERVLIELTQDEFKGFDNIRRRLIEDRNQSWLPKIEDYMATAQPHLIVVGVGHIVGTGGLKAMLVQKGYKVRQL